MKKKVLIASSILLLFFGGIAGSLILSNYLIERNAEGKIHSDIQDLKKSTVAIVLGTSAKTSRGTNNLFFVHRINAAAELYHSGKVDYLLLSGDNGRHSYDEPSDMKKALIKLGVPASKIYLDYAGFRTWDSMVRCKKVFGQKNFIINGQSTSPSTLDAKFKLTMPTMHRVGTAPNENT
jgi:SanA protein